MFISLIEKKTKKDHYEGYAEIHFIPGASDADGTAVFSASKTALGSRITYLSSSELCREHAWNTEEHNGTKGWQCIVFTESHK